MLYIKIQLKTVYSNLIKKLRLSLAALELSADKDGLMFSFKTMPHSETHISIIVGRHISPTVHFLKKAPNLAEVLINVWGTKLDIGPLQILILVGVAAIFKMFTSSLAYILSYAAALYYYMSGLCLL